ncbi:MAG: HDOD domain-containing protein [Thermodesulfobacteriota bacterium]
MLLRPDQALIRRRIFQIERLAAMPQVVWQLVEALGDDRTDAARLEKLIEGDPALASKVLRLANSVYYGLAQKITTIRRAIVIIGFQELELLAVGAGLAEIFDLNKVPRGFDGQGLWTHSLAVSWVARELAEAVRHPIPGEVMVAGLLHDLGKLVLATHLVEELTAILEETRSGAPYHLVEEELGLRHTTIGYWLASRWGLPEVHLSAIRHHHSLPANDPYLNSTCLVAQADVMVKDLAFGLVQTSAPVNQDLIFEATHLTRDHLLLVSKKAEGQVPVMLEAWQRGWGGDGEA